MSSLNTSDRFPAGRTGILLLQAPGEAAHELSSIANELVRAGLTVRCLLPAAANGMRPTRWRDWYADAECALTDMRKDCDVIIVGGSSVGAGLGLLLAANHPLDVQGTALFAPTLWLNGRLTPWAAMLVCLALGRRAAEAIGISPWLYQGPSAQPEVLERRRLLVAARRALNGINQPTLIVHSREDRCAGLDNAGYLQRHLRGLVDMVILGGSHHTANLDRQRDFIVEKATAFIASVARRPRRPAQIVKPAAQLATVLPKAA